MIDLTGLIEEHLGGMTDPEETTITTEEEEVVEGIMTGGEITDEEGQVEEAESIIKTTSEYMLSIAAMEAVGEEEEIQEIETWAMRVARIIEEWVLIENGIMNTEAIVTMREAAEVLKEADIMVEEVATEEEIRAKDDLSISDIS